MFACSSIQQRISLSQKKIKNKVWIQFPGRINLTNMLNKFEKNFTIWNNIKITTSMKQNTYFTIKTKNTFRFTNILVK